MTALVVIEYETSPQPYEVLIAQENIHILSEKPSEIPLFGENNEHYLIIYPATHYKTHKSNRCAGFKASIRSTWCSDEKIFPNCNSGIADCYRNYSD